MRKFWNCLNQLSNEASNTKYTEKYNKGTSSINGQLQVK